MKEFYKFVKFESVFLKIDNTFSQKLQSPTGINNVLTVHVESTVCIWEKANESSNVLKMGSATSIQLRKSRPKPIQLDL